MTTTPQTTPKVSPKQLAAVWGVPVRTVYGWVTANLVPYYRAGRLLRFDVDEVHAHFSRVGYVAELEADEERPGEAALALLTA